MGRLLSGLWLLILFIACGEKLPEGVLAREKMPALLVDIHLMEAQLVTKPIDSIRMSFYSSYDAVFQRHGIDSSIFNQSIQYYSTRPTVFKEIYTQVAEQIDFSIKADEAIRAEGYRQRLLADSLAAVHQRDSLFWLERDSLDALRVRHLLFKHDGDSTIDHPIPFDLHRYREHLWYDVGLGTGSVFGPGGSLVPVEGRRIPDAGTDRYQIIDAEDRPPAELRDRSAPSLRLRAVPEKTQ